MGAVTGLMVCPGVGVAAAADALPAPVQKGVADAVSVTGIDLPGGSDDEGVLVETDSSDPTTATDNEQAHDQGDEKADAQKSVDGSDDQGEDSQDSSDQ